MAPYTRMVPRAKARVGEIELECVCGEWIRYPGDDGTERWPSVCPGCGAEWHVMWPLHLGTAAIREAAAKEEEV